MVARGAFRTSALGIAVARWEFGLFIDFGPTATVRAARLSRSPRSEEPDWADHLTRHRQAGHAAGRLLVPAHFRPGAAGRRAANRVRNLRHVSAPIVSDRRLGAVTDGLRPTSCRRRGSLRLYARAGHPGTYPPPEWLVQHGRTDTAPCSEAWVSEATVVVTLFSTDSQSPGWSRAGTYV